MAATRSRIAVSHAVLQLWRYFQPFAAHADQTPCGRCIWAPHPSHVNVVIELTDEDCISRAATLHASHDGLPFPNQPRRDRARGGERALVRVRELARRLEAREVALVGAPLGRELFLSTTFAIRILVSGARGAERGFVFRRRLEAGDGAAKFLRTVGPVGIDLAPDGAGDPLELDQELKERA